MAAVRETFEANFDAGLELGARFCLAIDGEIVVDLMGGFADRARTRAFDAATLAPVYSTTKALAALMIARLVGEGRLEYRQLVAEVWPEFGQAGKAEITVEQALSHQAGLAGVTEPMDPSLWFDWDAICARLAAMSPLWPPGTASGYHPITFGYIAGEIFRCVDGRSLGQALREDIAEALGLDLWIGLPDAEHGRVAEMQKPSGLPRLGPIDEVKRAAFLTPWAAPGRRGEAEWRRAEIPSANGHATAEALARIAGAFACDGTIDGVEVLKPGVAAAASAERIRGQDRVLPFEISWGAGVMRNVPNTIYGPGTQTFGHSGWGGSCMFADPERRLSGAYVMNRQSTDLIGDPRSRRLIEVAYQAL
jgi:CubicO group peptidase (beta-lactamase class C family)